MSSEGAVWVAIIGSLIMGVAAVAIFIFCVRRDLFDNIEETKYQVFWADQADPPARSVEGDSAHVRHEKA